MQVQARWYTGNDWWETTSVNGIERRRACVRVAGWGGVVLGLLGGFRGRRLRLLGSCG
jgi:hypothetical protein